MPDPERLRGAHKQDRSRERSSPLHFRTGKRPRQQRAGAELHPGLPASKARLISQGASKSMKGFGATNCPCGHKVPYSVAEMGLPAGGSLGLEGDWGMGFRGSPACGCPGSPRRGWGSRASTPDTPAGRACLARPLVQMLAAREPPGDALLAWPSRTALCV